MHASFAMSTTARLTFGAEQPFLERMSETLFTRRDAIRLCAGAVAAVPAAALAAPPSGFTFVVVNDLHYRDERCGPWFERVVASIRALRPAPAFVFLAGDLSEFGAPGQLGAVAEIFRALPMPVRSVPGNHDCTSAGDFSAYRKIYRTDWNYRFDYAGWQFLAFDSTQGRSVYRTKISNATLSWLDGALPSVPREKPLVVLTHFPLDRNWLRPLNASAVLDRLAGWNFQGALGGHWHGITESVERGATLSTNRCSSWWHENHDGAPEKGYALCRTEDGRLTREFVQVV